MSQPALRCACWRPCCLVWIVLHLHLTCERSQEVVDKGGGKPPVELSRQSNWKCEWLSTKTRYLLPAPPPLLLRVKFNLQPGVFTAHVMEALAKSRCEMSIQHQTQPPGYTFKGCVQYSSGLWTRGGISKDITSFSGSRILIIQFLLHIAWDPYTLVLFATVPMCWYSPFSAGSSAFVLSYAIYPSTPNLH